MAERKPKATQDVELDTDGVKSEGQPAQAPPSADELVFETEETVEQPTTEIADGYTGRSKVVLQSRGKVTTQYGVFVRGEEVAVNAEAKKALLEMRDGHDAPLFREV